MKQWKDIIGYEGLYKISNYGDVYSCITNKLLKPSKNSKTNHIGVILCKNKQHKRFQVHRLVAIAFVPNPYNYNIVNHKDENPLNNYYTNLEWCTIDYNNKYSSYKLKGKQAWNKGVKIGPFSEEHKQKMSKGHIGKKLTIQTKQKISNSLKQYYQNKHN